MVTDFLQFGIAMTGSISAAVYALRRPEVGGLAGLAEKLDPKVLSLVPDFGDWNLALTVMIIPLTVQWWSVWYPGAEPGGGSYVAQRMLAARSERDALAGTLFFNVAHYALRSWPWIIVALARCSCTPPWPTSAPRCRTWIPSSSATTWPIRPCCASCRPVCSGSWWPACSRRTCPPSPRT
jgi:hypothetical protein